ncbi:ATP-binding protein [Elizabethkingia anophelis]|nr:ATP-binding protein [Elizabethkingia anophelis]
MIIDFSISNFGPIREEQTLSFEATADDHLEDYYIAEPISGLKLLKLLVLYGPNASGKSTFLKALDFLGGLCTNPLRAKFETLDFEPFLFDQKSRKKTSVLKLNFIVEKIKHSYEVEFTKNYILREVLQYSPKGRIADLYVRETDIENQLSKVTFGSTTGANSKKTALIEGNTIWNTTVIGAFNKTNVKIPELQRVLHWFENTLAAVIEPNTNLFSWTSNRIESDPSFKKSVIDIIKQAGIQISGIDIHKVEKELSEKVIASLSHLLPKEEMNTIASTKRVTTKNITFKHIIRDKKSKQEIYDLPKELESQGTQRFYGLSGVLSMATREEKIILIDELETSLHPDLMKHFLLIFLANSSMSQMMITTHNIFLLDERDILRNDAIWFTQKKGNGTTELYSLSDFDTKVIRKNSSIINSYKIGKLGAKPELGNIFITEHYGQNGEKETI